MRVGIIGTGNMGTIIMEAMIDSKTVPEENIYITNRTIEKAHKIKSAYKEIHVENDPINVILKSEIIFICVKPLDIYPLLNKSETCLNKR